VSSRLPVVAAALLAGALLLSGCVTHVRERCPGCAVVDGASRRLPAVRPGTERLFVIVPGVLGYGWEWDEAVRALRSADKTAFVVFWWEPWGSLRRASDDLHDALTAALYWTPPSVREIIVVGHSVGGLVAAHALAGLVVPNDRHVQVITVGAPFGGMLGPPFSWDDALRSPAMMSVMGTFRDYPKPPPRVDVVEYVTSYPSDPVMQPRYGHTVAPPEIGPRGARRIAVDPKFDHNQIVSRVLIGTLIGHKPPETLSP
jgi:hypothetical protein